MGLALIDRWNRTINYLRVSIIDRCNLRCKYCMPAEGVKLLRHEDILKYEEILAFVQLAVERGVDKVRVTGGEPLIRRGVVDFVSRLRAIDGINDLSMTTNAILLPRFASDLKDAGLDRLNISLDTLDAERFTELTRGGCLQDVLDGIGAAVQAGFDEIKLNCVVEKSREEPDARAVAAFGETRGFGVRFIPRMDIASGRFGQVDGGSGGHCSKCNRLRLSADGRLRPCLFSDLAYSIREMGYEAALEAAVENKPESGTSSLRNAMYQIGG